MLRRVDSTAAQPSLACKVPAARMPGGESMGGWTKSARAQIRRGCRKATTIVGVSCLTLGSAGAIVASVEAVHPGIAGAETTPACIVQNLEADGATVVYPLDDTAGVVAADATNNPLLSATISNPGPYDVVPGPLGCSPDSGALTFDGDKTGVTAKAAVSNGTHGSSITVMAWINAASLSSGNPRIVANSQTDSTNNGFQLEVGQGGTAGFFAVGTSSSAGCVCGTSAPWTNSTYTMPTKQWVFYVGTYNGSTVATYADGILLGAAHASGTINASVTPVTIGYGNEATGPADFFDGLMADVAILPSALTGQQIAGLYHVALARTNDETASWSGGSACNSLLTSAAPVGTFGSGVTLDGAGGGGGGASSGSAGRGGNGGEVNGYFQLTYPDSVSATVGCGGGAGASERCCSHSNGPGSSGGSGFGSGGASGGAGVSNDLFNSAAQGGGGGGSSGLCLATCDTYLATAGGGGGGGAQANCNSGDLPGDGGAGDAGATGTFSAGSNGNAGNDGMNGQGGGGGTAMAGGVGGAGFNAIANSKGSAGGAGASPAQSGGNGGRADDNSGAASGGGGGGGFTGGGGGGGDGCSTYDSGSAVAGGGGGGSSAVNDNYASSVSFSDYASSGGGKASAGSDGRVDITWYVANVAIATPDNETVFGGAFHNIDLVAADTAGEPLTYTQAGLPSWLAIGPATGVISPVAPVPGLGIHVYPVKVTATDLYAASATTSTFYVIVFGKESAPYWCSHVTGYEKFTTPGLSKNGWVTSSPTSKSQFTVSAIGGCSATKSGAPLAGVKGPGTTTIVSKNLENPIVSGKPITYTYDKIQQFISSGLSSLKKSLKVLTLHVGAKKVPFAVTSISEVVGLPCGANEIGVVVLGDVTVKPYGTKDGTITTCLGADSGTHTTGSFLKDLGSASAIIAQVYIDPATTTIAF